MNNVVRNNTTTYFSIIPQPDEEKLYSFLKACYKNGGTVDAVRSLISSGGIDINFQNGSGNTGLMLASSNLSLDICKLLLESGADPNVQNDSGCVALTAPCREGAPDLVELLLRYGANPNVVDRGGANPVICACKRGDRPLIALLLTSGTVTPHTMDRALFTAAQEGLHDIVSLLIENGANINLIDCNQCTALFWLKMRSPRTWKSRNKEVMESRYTLKECMKFLELVKFICSMTNTSGISRYMKGKFPLSIHRLGTPPGPFFANKLIKCCSLFIKNGQRLVDCGQIDSHDKLDERMTTLADVLRSYQMGFCGHGILEDEVAQRYLDGKPVFIPSGFKDHAVIFLLYAGYIALVNRGGPSIKTIMVYTLPEELKRIEDLRHHIHRMDELIGCHMDDFQRFISETLQHFPRGQLEPLLEENLALPPQMTSNCSWASMEAAIVALFGLIAVEEAGFLPGQEYDVQDRHNICLTLRRARALADDFTWFCISTYGEKYTALRQDLQEDDILRKIARSTEYARVRPLALGTQNNEPIQQ